MDFEPKTPMEWYMAIEAEEYSIDDLPDNIIPKTPMEKYYAKSLEVYDGDVPAPKTAMEYYTGLKLGVIRKAKPLSLDSDSQDPAPGGSTGK